MEQINDDKDIGPEAKLYYLLQATIAGSQARKDVVFPLTSANYFKAEIRLIDCFRGEDILVDVHVQELLILFY